MITSTATETDIENLWEQIKEHKLTISSGNLLGIEEVMTPAEGFALSRNDFALPMKDGERSWWISSTANYNPSGIQSYITRISPVSSFLVEAMGLDSDERHLFDVALCRQPVSGQLRLGIGNPIFIFSERNPDRSLSGRIWRVELGCDHQMEHRNLGRCYNESKCVHCGHGYRVDSSD